MKLTRNALKQMIAEEKSKMNEMCGDMPAEETMTIVGSIGEPIGGGGAVTHPSYAGSGDMSLPDDPFKGGDMAMSQLVQLMQNADSLKGLVSGDDELQGWVRGKLSKAGDYLDSITKFLEFEMLPDQSMTLELHEGSLQFSKNDLKWIIAEELNEIQDYSAIDTGDASSEDTLRTTIMDSIELLKAGDMEGALGQLQAAVDASTGGGALDR